MTHAVCPVNGVHTAAKLPGNAVASTGVPVDWPASQLAQVVWESVLNLATAQAVHAVAPAEPSVFVTEPGLQIVHELCPAEDVYFPAAHNVAPRQLVTVPPLVVQDVVPSPCTKYLPAGAWVHVSVDKSVAALA